MTQAGKKYEPSVRGLSRFATATFPAFFHHILHALKVL